MTIRIAITDDHNMIVKGIESMLTQTPDIQVVGKYSDAQSTLNQIEKDQPDILLLDINLPDINGIELSKTLLKKQADLKIIALTSHDEATFIKRMLKNGIHGYLLKNVDRLELITAFRTVLSGERYLQKQVQDKVFNSGPKPSQNNQLRPNLTRRELDVLKAISEELTTQEISEKLFISPKTVETHRMNIMSKLGAKNSVGIIKRAIELDLLGD